MKRTLWIMCVFLLLGGLLFAGGQGDKGGAPKASAADKENVANSLKADAVAPTLKAPDGQPLVFPGFVKQFPDVFGTSGGAPAPSSPAGGPMY